MQLLTRILKLKLRPQWLMVAMAVAMAGIVWIQGRWINEGLRSRHAERQAKARSALQKVAERMQYEETARLMQQQFKDMSDTLRSLSNAVAASQDLDETADLNPATELTKNGKNPILRKVPRSYMRVEQVQDTMIVYMDTMIVRRLVPRWYTDTTYIFQSGDIRKRDSLQPVRQRAMHQYQHLLDSSRGVLDRVFLQMITSHSPNVDSALLHVLITDRLRSEGIYSTTELRLTQSEGQHRRLLFGPKEPEGIDSVEVELYAQNLFHRKTYLTLYMPPDYSGLLLGMWGEILISLILLACMWGLFAFTIRMLSRQKKLSEMKSDFINNMTHELKTPLATIGIAAEALQNPAQEPPLEKVRRYAGIIKEESERLNMQVNRVLQTAEFRHKAKLALTPLSVQQLLDGLVSQFSFRMEKQGATFITQLPDKHLSLMADPVHLHQALANLLDNALKYSKENPVIELIAYTQGDRLCVQVKDNGIGMDRNTIRHIFEPFYRSHTGNRQDTRGYGIGLSYVDSVIAGHGGHINVTSRPGLGSVFTVYLPLL